MSKPRIARVKVKMECEACRGTGKNASTFNGQCGTCGGKGQWDFEMEFEEFVEHFRGQLKKTASEERNETD